MNAYGQSILLLPRKGLACQCKQDLLWFWEADVFTSEDNCWVEGISDTQQLSKVCKHYSRQK